MRLFRLLGVLALIFVSATFASAGGNSETKVKAKLTASKLDKDSKQTVTITLEIDKGWYLYANPTKANEAAELIVGDNRTVVSFKANRKVDADIKYPPGTLKKEIIIKEEGRWYIYQDKVTIVAEVRRPAELKELEAVVEVNACLIGSDGKTSTCLPKGKIVLKVP